MSRKTARLQKIGECCSCVDLVMVLLQNENLHFDELVKMSKIKSSKLGGILSVMEMKGMVNAQEGGFFCMVH